ncbi:MAG TPA: hypothetical protein VE974_03920 [Thermoanaerobaculia bacterium]|nr:hypothetical protein [Thermoanaerobaculia bacterium]
MEFDQKVEKAAAIVVGKVVSQESRWDAGQKRILTYSTFQVEKTLKGAQAAQTTIVTPGGVVGDVAQEFVGVPRFRVGDEHVVFVRNTSVGPTVLYFDQGAYRVVDEGGQRIVQPLVSSAVLVDTQRGMAVAPEDARPMRDFEARVRASHEKRQRYQMEMMRKRQQEASFWYQIQSNKTLVALALLGIALASWQFYKRS